MRVTVAGTAWTLLGSAEPAGRDRGPRQTNALNCCLRMSPLGILTVCVEFGMLRQQEHPFLVGSDGHAHLESGVLSNVASALYLLWVIGAPLSSARGSSWDEAL